MTKPKYPIDFNYQEAQEELNELLAWFENGSNELADALIKYKRAEELLGYMEAYLNDTEAALTVAIKNQKSS
jgi:exodeoxyribonuclease VII small subunit